jgi:hypothetical protein
VEWITLTIGVVAIMVIVWIMYRESGKQASADGSDAGENEEIEIPQSAADFADFLTPKPIGPSFTVDEWDGYTGLHSALSIGLADNVCYPLIEAGTIPPVEAEQTVSTGDAEQTHITVRLYTGLSAEVEKSKLFQEISIGPIPFTGEIIREVQMRLFVSAEGTVAVSTAMEGGNEVRFEIIREMQGAIAIGR